jgi:coenzyme F420 hydrogenase subunit beta
MSDPRSVVADGLCIGCGGCALAFPDKVRLDISGNGFQEPAQAADLTAHESNTFDALCPGLGYEAPDGRGDSDAVWGPWRSMVSGWSTDPEFRKMGSSGGALTAIAARLLALGTIDEVVGIQQDPDNPFRNQAIRVTSSDQVLALAGSRYSPAAPALALEGLEKGRRVAFIGKPCDVGMLRSYVASLPACDRPDVRLWLSFFCAGTPSWEATKGLVEHLGGEPAAIQQIRYRGLGWPGRFVAEADDGSAVSTTYEDSWGSHLNKQLHVRCKLCRDGVGATADLVAADSWETDERGYPLFDDQEGQSLIIARTQAGVETLDGMVADNTLAVVPFDRSSLKHMQSYQYERAHFAWPRSLGYRIAGRKAPIWPGFRRFNLALRYPITSLRQAVGSFRRARRELTG